MRTQRLEVKGGRVRLRPLVRGDAARWSYLRCKDEEIFRRVEPTVSENWAVLNSPRAFRRSLRGWKSAIEDGSLNTSAIELDGNMVGMVSVGGIQPFPVSSGWIGYWVGSDYTGGHVTTAAVALACDFSFAQGINRLEASVLADNTASISVLESCGFRHEGRARELFHMDGAWRDHEMYGLVRSDAASRSNSGGVVSRLIAMGKAKAEMAPTFRHDELG